MEQEKKGIELIVIGLMITLTANFLGGLDTGIWLSAVVFCVEALALGFVIAGLGRHNGQIPKWGMARGVAAVNLILCLILAGLTVWSMSGTTTWLAAGASGALIVNNILFIVLAGLILMGLSEKLNASDLKEEAKKAGVIWWWFVGLFLISLAARITAAILVNQAIPVLTYMVVIAGLPALAMGVIAILFIYRHA